MSDVGGQIVCSVCGTIAPAGSRFCASCGAALDGSAPAAAPKRARGDPPGGKHGPSEGDEMRRVTALFADVVGSTGLGERLGPDEVKALIGECVSRMARAVEEFGGVIQAYMGDGICAYFGLPAAHEDDEERAARSALRIMQLVGDYGRDIEAGWGIAGFNVRVGINSGQVAVGLVGGAEPQEVALGDTTNVAARLQSSTEPGTIAVGEATARRLAQAFRLEPVGALTVKGRGEPVPAWLLAGPRDEPAEVPPSALVGREAERARIAAVVEELVAGRGQVLLLAGDSGIGKTRMLAELRSIAGERVTWLEGRCLSYGGELLYWPFVEMLRGWLDVGEGEAEVAVRTRLRVRLAPLLGDALQEILPYLGRLLAVRLDLEPESDMQPPPPEQLARVIRAAYRGWIERLAAERPVVVAVDDLHWADPSTRELAEDLLGPTDVAPVLFAAAFRPDPTTEAWDLRMKVLQEYFHRAVEVPLGPLTAEASEELLDQMLPVSMLDPATRTEIVSRAEGNPLYLEELLRAVIEGGGEERGRTWTLPTASVGMLPPTLESLFIARIDRLTPGARRLAQAAAVVGRSFSVRVLERVAGGPEFQSDLSALLRAEIVRERRRFPDLECTFSHGLLQEAALSTLTPTRRRQLYGKVAAAFEEVFEGSTEDHLEALALYYYRSDDQARALAYLERAAERAASLGAEQQATDLWQRAAKVANRLGDAEAERRVAARIPGPSGATPTA